MCLVDDNECILLICDVTNNSNMNIGVVAGVFIVAFQHNVLL